MRTYAPALYPGGWPVYSPTRQPAYDGEGDVDVIFNFILQNDGFYILQNDGFRIELQ